MLHSKWCVIEIKYRYCSIFTCSCCLHHRYYWSIEFASQKRLLSIEFLSLLLYLGCMLFQVFFYCWYGNELQLKVIKGLISDDLSWDLIPWEKLYREKFFCCLCRARVLVMLFIWAVGQPLHYEIAEVCYSSWLSAKEDWNYLIMEYLA